MTFLFSALQSQVWYNAKERALPEDADLAGRSYQEIRHFDELVPYIKSLA